MRPINPLKNLDRFNENTGRICLRLQQIGKGFGGDEDKIILVFRASVGEPDPYDSVEIKGTPTIKSIIEGGVDGDVATCAITINALKQIIKTQPGLKTMADISLVSFFS